MRSLWTMAASVVCVAVIGGATIAWQVYKAKAKEQKLAEDAKVLRASAEQGDAKAEFGLGDMYYSGHGMKQDYTEAIGWYRKAADQGDAKAQYDIGYMFDLGQGVTQDYAEALRWYRKAADQGDANAQCGIGSMYYDGRGIQQDRAGASNWYHQAADRGLARAQYDLGYMYYYGQGVPQNRTEADRWYHKAADQGEERAQRALGLRGRGLSARSEVGLIAVFLGCSWFLMDFLFPKRSIRSQKHGALLLAELFGSAYVGLSLYGDFGIFHSLPAASAFYFVKNCVFGITIAMLISVFGLRSSKVMLVLSSILIVGTDFQVVLHRNFDVATSTNRIFCSVNGFLIGMSIALGVSMWGAWSRPRL